MMKKPWIIMLAALIGPALGCGSGHTPAAQTPEPPPAYGNDPFQTHTVFVAQPAFASGGVTILGAGTPLLPLKPLTEGEALTAIKATMETRSGQMAQGFDLEGEISSIRVSAGDEKRFAVAASKGRCLRLIAVADPGVGNLDMTLTEGEGGKLLDRDLGPDNYPVVSACFSKDQEVSLLLKVVAGAGWFMVRVYAKDNDGSVKRTMEVMEKAVPAK